MKLIDGKGCRIKNHDEYKEDCKHCQRNIGIENHIKSNKNVEILLIIGGLLIFGALSLYIIAQDYVYPQQTAELVCESHGYSLSSYSAQGPKITSIKCDTSLRHIVIEMIGGR